MNYFTSDCVTRPCLISFYGCFLHLLSKIHFGKCYVLILGFLGGIISSYDVVRLMLSGSEIPTGLKRVRLKHINISSEHERDIKLIFTTLQTEFFWLLCLSAVTDTPVLVLPWLTMHTLTIVGETVLFFVYLIDGSTFVMTCETFLRCLFAVFNWTQVFCEFIKADSNKDFNSDLRRDRLVITLCNSLSRFSKMIYNK